MRIPTIPQCRMMLNKILDDYREAGGEVLADRFFQEFTASLRSAALHPERHAYSLGKVPFRRAKLSRFPHVSVFRILEDSIRVTVVKHEKRRPSHGMRRR